MKRALKLTIAALVTFFVLVITGGLILFRIASDTIPPGKAKEIITRMHPGAVITDTDTEHHSGTLLYEIEYILNNKHHTAILDGESGNILSDTAQNEIIPEPVSEDINVEYATKKAITDAGLSPGEVNLKKATLENREGRAVYEIKFTHSGTEYEYIINAESGIIESITTKAAD